MAEELVRLTNQTEEMDEMVKEIPTLKVHLKVSAIKAHTGFLNAVFAECVSDVCGCALQDLQQRHNTILQMYGEKAEEAEELRLDLIDVKNMYKCQIDELLKNQK